MSDQTDTSAAAAFAAADEQRTPVERARDEARRSVYGAVRRMGHEAGAEFTERPIFSGASTTEQVIDPAAGIRMCRILSDAVSVELYSSLRRARQAGLSWREIGEAQGLEADRDRGASLAEIAYEAATDASRSQPWDQPSFYYECGACGSSVTDRGPYESHPHDNERGHADDCSRVAAQVAAWQRERDEWEAGQ